MKNKVLGLLCVIALGISFSCNDFLEEKPTTEMTLENYFRIPEHARSLVNTMYRDGASKYYHADGVFSGMFIMYGSWISGLYDNLDYKGQEVFITRLQTLNHNSRNITGQLDNLWDQAYRYSIARANTLIHHIDNIQGLTEEERLNLLGQAKFFRAFAYLHLVRWFGDVPLVLEPYEDLNDLYVERASSEQVYAQIIKDATEAAAGLPDKAFTDNGFRITKAAAETLLASAYLQMSGYPLEKTENYKNAATAARSVINGGKHALIQHVDAGQRSAYNILRTDDVSSEYIFSREYESMTGKSNNGALAQYSMPNSMISDLPKGFNRTIMVNVYKPSDIVLNAFDQNDLRIQEKQIWYKELDYVNKNDEQKHVVFNQTAVWRFYDEEALYETTQGAKDVNIYRYPEILLIAAEAIARSEGVNEEAIGYLAAVRARAYVYPGATSGITEESIKGQLRGLGVDAFVEEVWTERLRELAIDFKVWDDIQRTRKYPVTSASDPGKVTWVNVIGHTNPFGATYKETDLLFPLSDNERQRNTSLSQNPGFD